ncbi:hypothetical protein COO60DRAFT_1641131 [Scenedesmus sp. NREL 46B-D3]|nr:hypothetical protein COO60DRAFT_1641131 [Scenedesmus sp. NREL 46B-D3]
MAGANYILHQAAAAAASDPPTLALATASLEVECAFSFGHRDAAAAAAVAEGEGGVGQSKPLFRLKQQSLQKPLAFPQQLRVVGVDVITCAMHAKYAELHQQQRYVFLLHRADNSPADTTPSPRSSQPPPPPASTPGAQNSSSNSTAGAADPDSAPADGGEDGEPPAQAADGPPADAAVLCALPGAEVGPCRASIPRWSYDAGQGNDNRFDSQQLCMATCAAAMAAVEPPPSMFAPVPWETRQMPDAWVVEDAMQRAPAPQPPNSAGAMAWKAALALRH